VETNTARFTAAIEEQIRKYPDQWLWVHKRWKTRPDGEVDLYDDKIVGKVTAHPSDELRKGLHSTKPQKS
jgi:hypothetical protein